MKKRIAVFLILLVTLISGCSNPTQTIKNENVQLENRVVQLEKDLADKNNQVAKLQNKDFDPLIINYIENSTTKRFVEKQCDLLGLPTINSVKLNLIYKNTVVAILDTAYVENNVWLYVEIPVNDSPSNMKGWIKESDTVLYTQDKVKNIQSEVRVKQGEAVYEVFDFSNIKSTTPYKADDVIRGRIEEKKDGYVRLNCPGGNSIWVKEASIIYPSLDISSETIEQHIYRLVKINVIDNKIKEEVFGLIKDINWIKLNKIDNLAAMELLSWIDKLENINEENISNLLRATKGLDGAYTESYCYTIKLIFLKDKHKFLKCVSILPADEADRICSFLAYGLSYGNVDQEIEAINVIVNTEKLTAKEKIVAQKLIESLIKTKG